MEQAIDVRFDLREALVPLAEFGRIDEYLRQAEALARNLDDQRRLGWVSACMTGYHLITGSPATEARAFAQRVQAIGETLGDVPLEVAAQYYYAHVSYMSGDYRGTEDTCRRLMQFLQGDLTCERFSLAQSPAVLSRAFLARTLAERGLFHEGEAHGHEAIRIAEALDHPFSLVEACLGLAYLHGVRGELSEAIRVLERAVALCRDWNITIFSPNAMASLGHVYARSGRVGEGVSWLRQAPAGHDSAGIGYFLSVSLVQIGEAYLLADEVADAHACAERAVRLARERGERGHETWALRLLGDIASHQDRPDMATAEGHYGGAMALASELGMSPLLAHSHLGLGKLYRRTGDGPKAQDHLTTAATMYREMSMGFWLRQAGPEIDALS